MKHVIGQQSGGRVERRGRKATSTNVRLLPEFREEPDIEKLGRAILALAMQNAKNPTNVNHERRG